MRNLQCISTHFGRAGLETSWKHGNYVPEFAVLLIVIGANQVANFEPLGPNIFVGLRAKKYSVVALPLQQNN